MSGTKDLKQIAIDVNAHKILMHVKEEIRKTGRHPSLSDAIRKLWTDAYMKTHVFEGEIKK